MRWKFFVSPWLVTGILAAPIGVYLAARLVLPANYYIFKYFLNLFVLNSVFYFMVFRQSSKIGAVMLAFLVGLVLVTLIYYAFVFISATG